MKNLVNQMQSIKKIKTDVDEERESYIKNIDEKAGEILKGIDEKITFKESDLEEL